MMKISKTDIQVPLSVPNDKKGDYLDNYLNITQSTGKLFLFACDQKIEHFSKDFFGENASDESALSNHIFEIASKAPIGALATHLGLISRYGASYKNINYVVKLNGKTDLIKKEHLDPISLYLTDVEEVVEFKKQTGLNIVGVGYTIYLGSQYESEMLRQASQAILKAHKHGLLSIIWSYARGKSVKFEDSEEVVVGCAGVASSLGADFVKVKVSKKENLTSFKKIALAAGNTGVIYSGGEQMNKEDLLRRIHDQVNLGNAKGCAIGRNIFQRSKMEAIDLCKEINEILMGNSRWSNL